ncbi:MAG: lipid A biosynthesis acyltransferase [Gammaproteobacteria bacterium]|nr:lipid A biosynthesis acyltransferase [Gammaproteobacteria bacterium]
MSVSWKKQRERGSTGALRLILWIALNLGRRSTRLLLYPITLYFLLTTSTQRKASRQFLALALDRKPHLGDVARHFHTFAATILDRVFLLEEDKDAFDVNYHHPELVVEMAKQGRGCILLGSHLGSFEILRSMAKLEHQIPVKILMYPKQNERITQAFATLNPAMANTVIPLGRTDTLIRVSEEISQGALVGMLGDRTEEQDKLTHCTFFGQQTSFSQGPMLLASVLKAPVILFYGLYRGGNRYDIYFELLAEQVTVDRKQRARDIQQWTQRYAARLEHYARMAPYNWFNFYDFWNEDDTVS